MGGWGVPVPFGWVHHIGCGKSRIALMSATDTKFGLEGGAGVSAPQRTHNRRVYSAELSASNLCLHHISVKLRCHQINR